jgi:hypothetical protein
MCDREPIWEPDAIHLRTPIRTHSDAVRSGTAPPPITCRTTLDVWSRTTDQTGLGRVGSTFVRGAEPDHDVARFILLLVRKVLAVLHPAYSFWLSAFPCVSWLSQYESHTCTVPDRCGSPPCRAKRSSESRYSWSSL